jgi:predicted transcriptional regulator
VRSDDRVEAWAAGAVHIAAALREAVEQLPEDASIEDAMDRLYFLAKVARGIAAADSGDVVPHDEARRVILGNIADAR